MADSGVRRIAAHFAAYDASVHPDGYFSDVAFFFSSLFFSDLWKYWNRVTESSIKDAEVLLGITFDSVGKSRVVGGDSKFHVSPNSNPTNVLEPSTSPVLSYSIARSPCLDYFCHD